MSNRDEIKKEMTKTVACCKEMVSSQFDELFPVEGELGFEPHKKALQSCMNIRYS